MGADILLLLIIALGILKVFKGIFKVSSNIFTSCVFFTTFSACFNFCFDVIQHALNFVLPPVLHLMLPPVAPMTLFSVTVVSQ